MAIISAFKVLRVWKGSLSLYTSHLPHYRAFLEKLRQARLEAGLTQVQAAERMGKPQAFASRCELGRCRIDSIDLRMFAGIYNRTLGFFAE